MKNLIIGGVPEHFNLPWYVTLRNKEYTKKGINLRWKDFPGGTGAMNKALRDKEIDMAVILSEGIIRDIVQGNQSKIVQIFVKSPLIWGIHVAENSDYKTINDLKGTKAAISRYGSGSHLMAYINAQKHNWNLKTDLQFEVIKNLKGAIEGLPKGKGDYFMWEKFTTKPFVDNGTFRLIDECPTPWSCFVIAVRNDVLENQPESIKTILEIINKTTTGFKNTLNLAEIISERYKQKLEDVQQWLQLTQWSQENISEKEVATIQDRLIELKLIESKIVANKLLHNF
ncbi:MAG: substrate-binding domain-containing protein [Flavobacteriaceae bacterium]|nr:substrate-binding domain-containing protein [Flavobacteriaceae bacterium]